jgi:hypothetical protein
MIDDGDHNDVQRLWREQPSEEVQMSAQEVRGLAERFERTISRRNRREYAASAVVVVWFSVWAWFARSALVALGGWLVALAALWIVFYLHRRGNARRLAGEQDVMSGLEFTRSELVRQRDLLRTVWWWYLLPFMPGMLLIHVGYSLEHPERWSLRALGIFVAVTFVGIGLLNQRVARKLQRRIDDLDAVRKGAAG